MMLLETLGCFCILLFSVVTILVIITNVKSYELWCIFSEASNRLLVDKSQSHPVITWYGDFWRKLNQVIMSTKEQ